MTKGIKPEREYFTRLDVEKRKDSVSRKRSKLLKAELDKMKALHWMHCAKCGWELEELIFKGLTVHRCFHCGGTFLTEEEFEKLCGKESTFLDTVIDMFKF